MNFAPKFCRALIRYCFIVVYPYFFPSLLCTFELCARKKLLLVAGSPDRRQFPDIVVKRADLCGVWDVKFTLVSYGSGGGNIGERLSELERRMDELTKRIDDAASAGGAGR